MKNMYFIVLLYIRIIKPLIPSNPLNNGRGPNLFVRVTINHRPLYAYELLDKEGTYTVHEKNIQKMLIEMFKAKYDVGPYLLK